MSIKRNQRSFTPLQIVDKSRRKSRFVTGFTLIELIMTIVIIGLLMGPLGIMSLEFMRAIPYSKNLATAAGLAKIEFAKIANLSYADATLDVGDDITIGNYEGYPLDVRRTVTAGPIANTKQVQVRVYPAGNTTSPLVNVITYIANTTFGAGSGGSGAGSVQANFLMVSGGAISGKNLINVTLQNTDLSNAITIKQITISFTGAGGINLQKVTIGGTDVFTGNASSGDTITLSPAATLAANTSYANPTFLQFNKSLSSVTSLVFIMNDAGSSQTVAYSW